MFIASNQMDDALSSSELRHFISLNFDRIFDKIVCPWTRQRKSSTTTKRNWSRWRIQEEAFSLNRNWNLPPSSDLTLSKKDGKQLSVLRGARRGDGKWVAVHTLSKKSLARIQCTRARYQNTWRTWFRPMSLLINQLTIEDWKERKKNLKQQRPSLTSLEAGSQFTMS